jgi:anti-anti-sigma regulatory factor
MDNRSRPHPAVTVACDDSDAIAYVRIIGDVDTTAGTDLTDALDRLAELVAARVYIDLTATTSADATLLTFLARVATTIAPHATWLYRPSATARHMIELAGVDALTSWCDELPHARCGRPAAAA